MYVHECYVCVCKCPQVLPSWHFISQSCKQLRLCVCVLVAKCVCVCVCVCVWLSVWLCVRACMCECMYTQTHTPTCTHPHACTHTHTGTHSSVLAVPITPYMEVWLCFICAPSPPLCIHTCSLPTLFTTHTVQSINYTLFAPTPTPTSTSTPIISDLCEALSWNSRAPNSCTQIRRS